MKRYFAPALLFASVPLFAQGVPPIIPGADAAFKAQCRKDYLAGKPPKTDWIPSACQEDWKSVVAAQPMTDVLLKAVPAKAGTQPSLPQLKAALAPVRWGGKNEAGALATGMIGQQTVVIGGAGKPQTVSVNWWAKGEPIPFNLPAALKSRGATMKLMSCEKMGVGEGQREWQVSVPGRAPFALTLYQMDAPTGFSNSTYGAEARLDGKAARPGNTSCEPF